MSATWWHRAYAVAALSLAGAAAGGCALFAPFPDVAPDPEGDDARCVGPACTGAIGLAAVFGDEAEQRGLAVAAGEDAVAIAGRATGSIDLGDGATAEMGSAGKPDGFLGAFDGDGQLRWSHRFADSEARGVAILPGGDVVIAGGATGDVDFGGGTLAGNGAQDVFVARFDASGAHRWSRRFDNGNGATQVAHAVAVDAAGNTVVTGTFQGKVDFGEHDGQGPELQAKGGSDGFVAKLDPEGEVVWAIRFGDVGKQQVGAGVALDDDGSVVLTGWFKGSLSFGGEAVESTGVTDMFVAKLSAAGDPLWTRAASSTHAAVGLGVAVDGVGNVFATGSFRSSITIGTETHATAGDKDIVLMKLDENGVPLWSARFGDDADQEAVGVAVDPTGNVLLTGLFLGALDFGAGALTARGAADGFVAKLDAGGAPLWTRAFGDSSEQIGAAVAEDPLGHVWVTGTIHGSADFGAITVQSSGAGDAFLADFSP